MSSSPLITILGPTASGKTRLAVEVARRVEGAVISADSRQVYRGMDIGTGKDLSEYGEIPYHLIDIVDPGMPYDIAQYQHDFRNALLEITAQGLRPVLCGGSGLYIQAVLQDYQYTAVPPNPDLRLSLSHESVESLRQILSRRTLPPVFKVDTSTKKRLIRAIEISDWLEHTSLPTPQSPSTKPLVLGVNPELETRRKRITERLHQRLDDGLLQEVRELLDKGVKPERLIYFGLEYKYATQYLQGELEYEPFVAKLNTEIHRFAKRQMTYFRKMEKDGLHIHWLASEEPGEMLEEAMQIILLGPR